MVTARGSSSITGTAPSIPADTVKYETRFQAADSGTEVTVNWDLP